MEQTSISCALFLLLSLLSISVQSRRISCASSGSVNEGESALVTCDYHTNLRRHRRGFYIYKYPFGGDDPDVAAICKWEEDFLRCDLVDGYDVRVHGHRMALNISSAQQAHAGRYVCHILQPGDDIHVEECNLVVKKMEHNVKVNCHAITNTLREHPTTVMCFVPESLNATSIVLKRIDPKDTAAAGKEIMRCNSKTDMCNLRDFGYQFNINTSPSMGFKVMFVMVDTPGRYVCKAEGDRIQAQSCVVDVAKDTKTETVKVTCPQHSGLDKYVWGVSLSVLVAVSVVATAWFIRFLRRKNPAPSVKDATDSETNTHPT